MLSRVCLLIIALASATALTVPPTNAEINGQELAAENDGRRLTSYHYSGGYGSGSTYGQRNQNGFIGFLAGIALLFIAPFLLVMTEVQGVKITRLLNKARAPPRSPASRAQASTRSSMASWCTRPGPISVKQDASGAYTDKATGVSFGAGARDSATVNPSLYAFPLAGGGTSTPLKIERTVEVYQWVEREEQDAHTTNYVYESTWLEIDVPSNNFKMRNHINFPRPVDIKSSTIEMPQACLGAYGLTKAALEKADWWGTANINPNTTLSPDLTAKNGRVVQMETCMGIYIPSGQPPVDQFAIGDMRITYRTLRSLARMRQSSACSPEAAYAHTRSKTRRGRWAVLRRATIRQRRTSRRWVSRRPSACRRCCPARAPPARSQTAARSLVCSRASSRGFY